MNFSRLNILLLLLIAGPLFFTACDENDPAPLSPTPYTLEIPSYFPTQLNIPEDNPLTVEGIHLGRYLFYDGRLSGRTTHDSLMSCGSCHLQSNSFEPGIGHPVFQDGHTHGLSGVPTPHMPLPLINLIWNPNGYLWNGLIRENNPDISRRNLEDLVWMGVVAPHEMDGDTNRTKALIQQIPGYRALFGKAFGSETITMKNISRAIAQFVRTLVSADSKFDRYMRGEVQLTQQELNGFILFTTEEGGDCFHCHGSSGNPLFTTNLFYNNGKDTEFNDTRDRYAVTGDERDRGAYKATTLRNISLTGPYMHDGRFETLDEVIDFYSHQVKMSPYVNALMHHVADGGVQLTPTEKAELKAFLLTLTDESFLTNPDFAPPALFPDGLAYEEVAGRYYIR
ncbi:MAG: cytochrome c peroxidase [Bacteroidota bacterium]